MIRHLPAKFGDHRHCVSGDIIFLVAEEEIPDALASIRHYCLRTWVESTRHIILLTPILVTRAQNGNCTKL